MSVGKEDAPRYSFRAALLPLFRCPVLSFRPVRRGLAADEVTIETGVPGATWRFGVAGKAGGAHLCFNLFRV